MSEAIFLNDILHLNNIENTKIRFNIMFEGNWNPIEVFQQNKQQVLLEGQYWNYAGKKSFKDGQVTIGFIRIHKKEDYWLLFHAGQITKDLDRLDGVGYEFESIPEYEKYLGRLVIKFKNNSQTMIRNASSVIEECEVYRILPNVFDNDIFPGYENVSVSWSQLSHYIEKETWKTALQNQKGVYLITDLNTGKMYVGSAYGEDMILGRWKSYIRTGDGGNVELKALDFDYIKANFSYSILDIFKASIDDQVVIDRESYWKEVLMTRKFGFNKN